MIDILIVNYNGAPHLRALLDRLVRGEGEVRSRRARFRITVVDNHSTDDSAEVAGDYPSVQTVLLDGNRGYSAAVNAGLAATDNREIVLLNSDILLSPGAVASLVRIWERMGCAGIIGPLHLEPDGTPQLTWGTRPTAAVEWRRRGLDRGLARREPWARRQALAECCTTREVDWVSGSCMFFGRTVVEQIGGWDENFFLFFEDIDWCLRARRLGIPVFHTAEVSVIHAHGASVKGRPALAEVAYRRSQCYFTVKHLGPRALRRLRLYLTLKMAARWVMGRRSGCNRSTTGRILRDIWAAPPVRFEPAANVKTNEMTP